MNTIRIAWTIDLPFNMNLYTLSSIKFSFWSIRNLQINTIVFIYILMKQHQNFPIDQLLYLKKHCFELPLASRPFSLYLHCQPQGVGRSSRHMEMSFQCWNINNILVGVIRIWFCRPLSHVVEHFRDSFQWKLWTSNLDKWETNLLFALLYLNT